MMGGNNGFLKNKTKLHQIKSMKRSQCLKRYYSKNLKTLKMDLCSF